MLISEKKYYLEVKAILQEDKDFTKDDLRGNALVGGKLLELSSEARSRIAQKNGWAEVCWSGHYNPDSKTVKCIFKNPIYIDEESNTVMIG